MGACARVALISMTVSASFALAGCAAIDDLRASISRWFDTANFPGEGGVLPGNAPEASPVLPAGENPEGGEQGTKEEGQDGAQAATAADRCASSKETTDLRSP